MSDSIVTLLVGLFGGSTIASIISAIVSWRKGVRDSDVEKDQTAFEQMKDILAEHKTAIIDLKATAADATKRLDDLAEENRLYRWTMIGVIDRLRQKPRGTVDDVIDFIHERIPALRKED